MLNFSHIVKSASLDEDSVALVIDRRANEGVWNGSRFTDRASRLSAKYGRVLLDEIEKSLLAQDNYGEFVERVNAKLGIGGDGTVHGPLSDMMSNLELEGRMAWQQAIGSYNDNVYQDTVQVWRAELDERTTPGCWDNHGRYGEELRGAVLPRHWKCRCIWMVVPNPDSADLEWATQGREIIADMVAEREQDEPTAREADVPLWLMEPVGATKLRRLWREIDTW